MHGAYAQVKKNRCISQCLCALWTYLCVLAWCVRLPSARGARGKRGVGGQRARFRRPGPPRRRMCIEKPCDRSDLTTTPLVPAASCGLRGLAGRPPEACGGLQRPGKSAWGPKVGPGVKPPSPPARFASPGRHCWMGGLRQLREKPLCLPHVLFRRTWSATVSRMNTVWKNQSLGMVRTDALSLGDPQPPPI